MLNRYVLFLSLIITFPTIDGILSAFVANPIPNIIASSVPRNSESNDSSFRC
jgi:hypothetical protein